MKLSQYQKDIIKFVENGQGSAFISASAGSAKTFTLIESSKKIDKNTKTLMVAFNKHIATELQSKVSNKSIEIKTLNSLGYSTWKKYIKIYKRDYLNANKIEDILEDLTEPENFYLMKKFQYLLKQLVSKAKHNGLVPNVHSFRKFKRLKEDNSETWRELISFYGLNEKIRNFSVEEVAKKVLKKNKLTEKELENFIFKQEDKISEFEDAVTDVIISIAREALIKSIKKNKESVDFDDQIYLPVIYNLKTSYFDFIFVDELQDLSLMNVELLKLFASEKCRVLGFGDSRQRIYTWRGADQNSIDNFVNYFNCKEMPLTICYRCAKSIIKEAQTLNDEIEEWEDAPEGSVEQIEELIQNNDIILSGKDMILSRYNAPLVFLAIQMIKKNMSIQFVGKDVQQQLKTLIIQLTINPDVKNVYELNRVLHMWFDTHKKRLEAKYGSEEDIPNQIYNPIKDNYFCLESILDSLYPSDHVSKVYLKIDSIFKSKKGTKLSSIHKSKGLEAERVFILDRDKLPPENITNEWQKIEEDNILYVGITRAKNNLIYCKSDEAFRKKYYKNKKKDNVKKSDKDDLIVKDNFSLKKLFGNKK